MENKIRKISGAIGAFLGRMLVALFAWSLCAMVLWNHIAYEFNLPTFSYWTFVLLRLVILYWHSNSKEN